MNKINVKILGKSKLSSFIIDNVACVDIDKLITKLDFNEDRVIRLISPIFNVTNNINLYGLPELVYRLKIPYHDKRILCMLSSLKSFLRNINSKCNLVQNNIRFDGYVDLQPLNKCILLNKEKHTLYVHRIIQDILNMIGYQTSQFPDLLRYTNDLSTIIPEDLIYTLPLNTDKNNDMYIRIKQILME